MMKLCNIQRICMFWRILVCSDLVNFKRPPPRRPVRVLRIPNISAFRWGKSDSVATLQSEKHKKGLPTLDVPVAWQLIDIRSGRFFRHDKLDAKLLQTGCHVCAFPLYPKYVRPCFTFWKKNIETNQPT